MVEEVTVGAKAAEDGGPRWCGDSVALLAYGHGFQALRPDDQAGHSLGLLLQFDLERHRHPELQPPVNPYSARGLLRLFRP